MNYSIRIPALVYLMLVGLLLLSSCAADKKVDPFWDLNLEWSKEVMLDKLHEYSREGKIDNCVFSYSKESYLRDGRIDARITGSLNMPVFKRNNLKSLSYSLLVEFRNDLPTEFNEDFFYLFKEMMISSYGNDVHELMDSGKVTLDWKANDRMNIRATVLKEINHYSVEIARID